MRTTPIQEDARPAPGRPGKNRLSAHPASQEPGAGSRRRQDWRALPSCQNRAPVFTWSVTKGRSHGDHHHQTHRRSTMRSAGSSEICASGPSSRALFSASDIASCSRRDVQNFTLRITVPSARCSRSIGPGSPRTRASYHGHGTAGSHPLTTQSRIGGLAADGGDTRVTRATPRPPAADFAQRPGA